MPLKILEPLSLAVKYLSVLILWGAWLGCTRPKKTAITSENHCFGARGAGDFHFSCVLCRSKGGVDAYAPEAAILSLDVLGEGQAILPGIFQQELAELLLRNRRFQIILSENC